MKTTATCPLLGTLLIVAAACGDNTDNKSSDTSTGNHSGTGTTHEEKGGAGGGASAAVGGSETTATTGGNRSLNVGNVAGNGVAGASNVSVCQKLTLDASSVPPRVVFVQDLSSSMKGTWQPLDDAMVAIATENSQRFQLGLIPFSSIYLDHAEEIRSKDQAWFDQFFRSNDSDCTISDASIIAPATGNAPVITAAYDKIVEARMVGGTPTNLAMQKAREVLVDRDPKDGSSAYVILVTDGAPNCPIGNASNLIDDVESRIASLAAANVSTYVVGYNYNGEALDDWAVAGKTDRYYNAANKAELLSAMSAIISGIVPCEYTLSATVKEARFVRVTIDGKDRPLDNAADGWTLSADRRTVILTGTACGDLRANGHHTVDVVVECEEVVVLF